MIDSAWVTDVAEPGKRGRGPTLKADAEPERLGLSLTWQPLLLIAAGTIDCGLGMACKTDVSDPR